MRHTSWLALLMLFCWCCSVRTATAAEWDHGPLRVSANGRYLIHGNGTPFFYLGDTAWELFHRLNKEEAERYLENRQQKGFTAIQAVVLAELDGLNTPNSNGDRPLLENDPAKPNEAYFRHVDTVVRIAAEKGLYIAMLPTWGDKVVKTSWGRGPIVFNPAEARKYGRFLGRRYRETPNLIWVLGGDRDPRGVEPVWRAMAEGLREGDGGSHLITFHPDGGHSSSEVLHGEPWLDFNMLQSGHHRKDIPNYEMIARDYSLKPVKPCLDGEPRYENHPVNWDPKNGWFDDADVRQAAYWSVFAGALGHTYGCHDIWQMKAPGREAVGNARGIWYESLDLPGAGQMQYVKKLVLSRPFLARVPDQSLVAAGQTGGEEHVQATRGEDYAFVYVPTGKPVSVTMGSIRGKRVKAWWYDPRGGTARALGEFENTGTKEFSPPGPRGRGQDWVLVLDDASRNYGPPGRLP